MMLMIDVWCLVFDVKFDVDVAGKPEAMFNLWAKGQNESSYSFARDWQLGIYSQQQNFTGYNNSDTSKQVR